MKKCKWIIFAGCIFFKLDATAQNTMEPALLLPGPVQQLLDNGIAAAKTGKYPEAINYFEEARKQVPNSPLLLFNQGIAESRIPGRELRAICCLKAFLNLTPVAKNEKEINNQVSALLAKYKENLSTLCRVLYQPYDSLSGMQATPHQAGMVVLWAELGELDLAKRYADRVVIENYSSSARSALALAQGKKNDWPAVQATLSRIYHQPYKDWTINQLITQLTARGEIGIARSLAEQVLDSARRHYSDWTINHAVVDGINRGEELIKIAKTYFQEGNVAMARKLLIAARPDIEMFEAALTRSIALTKIGEEQVRIGDINEAKRTLDKLISIQFDERDEYYRLTELGSIAKLQAATGDLSTAYKTLAEIPYPYYKGKAAVAVAVIMLYQGDMRSVDQLLLMALGEASREDEPGSAISLSLEVADIYIKAGQIPKARKIVDNALVAVKSVTNLYYKNARLVEIADLMLSTGDSARAKKIISDHQLPLRGIEEEYKIYAKALVAQLFTKLGDSRGARELLDSALVETGLVKGSKDYAFSRIAISMAKNNEHEASLKLAERISYDPTRWEVIETVASLKKENRDEAGAKQLLYNSGRTGFQMEKAFFHKWKRPPVFSEKKDYSYWWEWTNLLDQGNEGYSCPLKTAQFIEVQRYFSTLAAPAGVGQTLQYYRDRVEKMILALAAVEDMLNQ